MVDGDAAIGLQRDGDAATAPVKVDGDVQQLLGSCCCITRGNTCSAEMSATVLAVQRCSPSVLVVQRCPPPVHAEAEGRLRGALGGRGRYQGDLGGGGWDDVEGETTNPILVTMLEGVKHFVEKTKRGSVS